MHVSRLAGSMPISKYYKSLFLVISIMAICSASIAQPIHSDLLKRTYLEYVNNLPKYLLTTKSAVILIAPTRKEAEAMAEEAHPTFVKSGIDAVAYYHIDDLFTSDKVAESLIGLLEKREIKYAIVIQKEGETFTLVITALDDGPDYIKQGKKAWKMTNTDLSVITNAIYGQAYSMERQNFLVIDHPEFTPLNVKLKGRRYEAYRPDLKSEMLAIRYFKKLVFPDSVISSPEAEKINEYITSRNAEIDRQNQHLEVAFANYPYPHEFVSDTITDKELNDKSLRYVVEWVHTTNSSVRAILGFSEKTDVTEYVSVNMSNGQGSIKRIPAKDVVYKYYVHHIPSGSNYLGTKWDADVHWEQALQNYLQLMRAEID